MLSFVSTFRLPYRRLISSSPRKRSTAHSLTNQAHCETPVLGGHPRLDQYLKLINRCAVLEAPLPHSGVATGPGFLTTRSNLPGVPSTVASSRTCSSEL